MSSTGDGGVQAVAPRALGATGALVSYGAASDGLFATSVIDDLRSGGARRSASSASSNTPVGLVCSQNHDYSRIHAVGIRSWAATVDQTDIRGSGQHDWEPLGAASVYGRGSPDAGAA